VWYPLAPLLLSPAATLPPAMEHSRPLTPHCSYAARPTNQTARPAWPNARTPARSTGGDRPSGTDMNRVAEQRHRDEARGCCSYDRALPKSVPGATKHTGGSRSHAHRHRSQWREPPATRPGSRQRTGRSNGSGGTEDVRAAPRRGGGSAMALLISKNKKQFTTQPASYTQPALRVTPSPAS
jgi:hypothetical protein